jgi:hypothetical protein
MERAAVAIVLVVVGDTVWYNTRTDWWTWCGELIPYFPLQEYAKGSR